MPTLQHWRGVLAGLAVICFLTSAHAVDPNRNMSQYIREQWGIERGFPGGTVHAITQTPDGYLWIGTDKGLVRFDGVNFTLIHRPAPEIFPDNPVLGLTTDADGNLWVRMQSLTVLRYHDGKFENATANMEPPEVGVTAMCRRKDGAIVLSALTNGTLIYSHGRLEKLAPTVSLRGSSLVISLAATHDASIWMGTISTGLFSMDKGRVGGIRQGLPDKKINCLLPVGDRNLLVGTDNGVALWDGVKLAATGWSPALGHTQILSMIQDRQSNVWLGTANGLFRVTPNGVSSPDHKEDRTNGGVTALFEDREGNLWVGSARGIERIRDSAFITYAIPEGLPSENNGPIYVDGNDQTWFAPQDGGLYWFKGTHVEKVTQAGIGSDVVYAIIGDTNGVWIGRQHGGLTHLQYKNGGMTQKTYTQRDGLAGNSIYALHQSRDGSLWAATLSAGVSQFRNGRFTTYTTAKGLNSNSVASIEESPDGTMWFATPSGLNALSKGHWRGYGIREGLPSDDVNCLLEDSDGVLWIGTAGGIAFLRSNHGPSDPIQVPAEKPAALREPVFGIAEDRNGWLWLATATHVLRMKRNELLSGKFTGAGLREYGLADGLRSTEGIKRSSSVIGGSRGQIWFSTNRGISMVDPSQLKDDSAPAMVHVEAISADASAISIMGPVKIPPDPRRITFRFAGLSMAVPERVEYRYMLTGFDRGWNEPVTTREAIYTNLGPGSYTFHVIASNSDGVWNGPEESVHFEVEPAIWQTWWFRFSCIVAAVFIMLSFYRLRLLRTTRQLNVRFEERLAERTRIAQDLHDTLLQGFLSASMQLHVADDHIATDSPAKPILSRVLQLMEQVIDEGRNAVRGLRSPGTESDNLEQAFSRIPQELAMQRAVDFRVIVEGQAQPLNPVIRDEVYRIGREALSNALRHANASAIELELEYAESQLRVLVRDNGRGIDSKVLVSGRDGHWGLAGMRERAGEMGARFRVWSRPAGGTEVELTIPSHIAFLYQSSGPGLRWLSRLRLRERITPSKKEGADN